MRGKISTFDFFEILTVIITFIVIIFTTALILAIVLKGIPYLGVAFLFGGSTVLHQAKLIYSQYCDAYLYVAGDTDRLRINPDRISIDFGLFPHMTVFDNITYGLKIRKMDKGVQKKGSIKWQKYYRSAIFLNSILEP